MAHINYFVDPIWIYFRTSCYWYSVCRVLQGTLRWVQTISISYVLTRLNTSRGYYSFTCSDALSLRPSNYLLFLDLFTLSFCYAKHTYISKELLREFIMLKVVVFLLWFFDIWTRHATKLARYVCQTFRIDSKSFSVELYICSNCYLGFDLTCIDLNRFWWVGFLGAAVIKAHRISFTKQSKFERWFTDVHLFPLIMTEIKVPFQGTKAS